MGDIIPLMHGSPTGLSTGDSSVVCVLCDLHVNTIVGETDSAPSQIRKQPVHQQPGAVQYHAVPSRDVDAGSVVKED